MSFFLKRAGSRKQLTMSAFTLFYMWSLESVEASEFQSLYNHNISELYLQPSGFFRLAENINGSSLVINERPEKFTGWLDGNNHAFFQLNLSARSISPNHYGGLFHRTQNSHIGNVTFYDSDISGFEYSGLLAGELVNSVVENVRVMGGMIIGLAGNSSTPYAGTLAGKATNSSFSDVEIAIEVFGGRGKTGARGLNGNKGSTGTWWSGGRRGTSGTIGGKGGDGVSIGVLVGDAEGTTFERIVVRGNSTLLGGIGGTGGNGGNGGSGGTGGNAPDCCNSIGGQGGNGGDGGDGGDGGSGGNVGLFGRWNETVLRDSLLLNANFSVDKGGMYGIAGSGGPGGSAGSGMVKGFNGKNGTAGSNGLVGEGGFVSLTETLPSFAGLSNYFHKDLVNTSDGYSSEQLKQPATFANLGKEDWRLQEGYYPYPLALGPLYIPAEPYLNYGNDFAYPRVPEYKLQPSIDQPLDNGTNWATVLAGYFADFLRPMTDGSPSVISTQAPAPDSVFNQWAPEGLFITAHKTTNDGRHFLLWRSKEGDTSRFTDFFRTDDDSAPFEAGDLNFTLPSRGIDLLLWKKQVLLFSENTFWLLTPSNKLIPHIIDNGYQIERVLTQLNNQLWLLTRQEEKQQLLKWSYEEVTNLWHQQIALSLPEPLHNVQAVIAEQYLYILGQNADGDTPIYRLDSSGNAVKQIILTDWLAGKVSFDTIRLFWYENTLHVVGHNNNQITLLPLTEQNEIIRTAEFMPDGLEKITGLEAAGAGSTLSLSVTGIGTRGNVDNWDILTTLHLPVSSLKTVYQLTGVTQDPIYNHNVSEIHRNPDGHFYLAEDIYGLHNADQRIEEFRGRLDGRNHAIYGLNYTGIPPLNGGGLFHRTVNASIGNLTFYDSFVSGFPYSGLLASESKNSLFENLRLMGGIVLGKALNGKESWASALVGLSESDHFRNIEIATDVYGESGLNGMNGSEGMDGSQPATPAPPPAITPEVEPGIIESPKGYIGYPGNNGTAGEAGASGSPGVHSSILSGVSSKSEYSYVVSHNNVSVTSGDGGNGGHGGSGGDGGMGGQGSMGGSVLFNTTDYQPDYLPGSGGDGGRGGNGGDGGNGGQSGMPGRIGLIIHSNNDTLHQLVIGGQFVQGYNKLGQPGLEGYPGKPGEGGQAGEPGLVLFVEDKQPDNFTQPDIKNTAIAGEQGLSGNYGEPGTFTKAPGSAIDLPAIIFSADHIQEGLADADLRNASNYKGLNFELWHIREHCQPYPVKLEALYFAHNNDGGDSGDDSLCYPRCTSEPQRISRHQALLYKRLWHDTPDCFTHYRVSPESVAAFHNDTMLSLEPQSDNSTTHHLHTFRRATVGDKSILIEASPAIEIDSLPSSITFHEGYWFLVSENKVHRWSEEAGLTMLPSLGSFNRKFMLLNQRGGDLYLSTRHNNVLLSYQLDDNKQSWKPKRIKYYFVGKALAGVVSLDSYSLLARSNGEWWLNCGFLNHTELSNYLLSVKDYPSYLIDDWLMDQTIEQVEITEDPYSEPWLHLLIRTDVATHWFRFDPVNNILHKSATALNVLSEIMGFDVDPVNKTVQAFAIEGLNADSLQVWSASEQDWLTQSNLESDSSNAGWSDAEIGGFVGGLVGDFAIFGAVVLTFAGIYKYCISK
ncbi:collagen-like protein [Endozoicomonas numazuensis]|uniref:Uncharacterized protein n=1 Tax=Endozoicomonas numazuensis TaxID=1137799 RepID=A0A081MYS4_9GAMM|nr:collagen-like protein [Endozoicomonas numazuensis]KEQ11347.1 hypothetical protein GZ78_29165 [Endozoicomonas numazuensis]